MKKEVIDLLEKNRSLPHYPNFRGVPEEFQNDYDSNKFVKWILHDSAVASLLLDIKIPHTEMLQEVYDNIDLFVKHRGGSSPGWASMALHGTAVHHTQPANHYFKKGKIPDYDWTELADSCPISKEWVSSLGFTKLQRVRFMKLDPGGFINPHRDTDIQGLHAYNVAINNPEGHEFVMDDHGLIPWQPGQIRLIDISKYHTVVNNGTEPRIHMIIHGHFGEQMRDIIIKSYLNLCKQI